MTDTQTILEAIEKNKKNIDAKIDSVREEVNRNHANLYKEMDQKFRDTNECINSIQKELSVINVHLDRTQEDIKEFEEMLQGNGTPGLKLKVELLDHELEQIKQLRTREETEKKQTALVEKKSNMTIRAAIITAAIGGTVSLITMFVNIVIM